MIRYGIIGTGMMGVEHIENIAAVDGTHVTAIADTNEGSRAAGAAAAPDAAVFSDHRALLDADVCDAIVIVTPNMTHVDVLGDVLETDAHILVEKPLCTTTADVKKIMAQAEGRDSLVWVGLEYRYMPPVAKLAERTAAGDVGDVRMVAIREHRFPFLHKVDSWNRLSKNTGGTLVEKCCHFFDLMNLLTGQKPLRVLASGGQDVNHLDEIVDGQQSDILDNAYVIVEYPDGVRALLDLCMFAEATRNQEEVSVVGTDGKLEAFLPQNQIRYGRRDQHSIGNVEETDIVDPRVKVEGLHHGSSYLEHLDFADAIKNGTEAKVTLEDGLWSVAMGEAAHLSIAEGRTVELSELI